MNKEEAVKWMTESKLAENEFSAGYIWDGLHLESWEAVSGVQKELVKTYRELRGFIKDTKLCYEYALAGVELPKDEQVRQKVDFEKRIKELGYHD